MEPASSLHSYLYEMAEAIAIAICEKRAFHYFVIVTHIYRVEPVCSLVSYLCESAVASLVSSFPLSASCDKGASTFE